MNAEIYGGVALEGRNGNNRKRAYLSYGIL